MNNFKLKIYLPILLCTVLVITIIFLLLTYKSSSSFKETKNPNLRPTLQPRQKQACIQVITAAKDPLTGRCQQFPTPCDVPNGWQKVSSCVN